MKERGFVIVVILLAVVSGECGGLRLAEALHVNPAYLPAVQKIGTANLNPLVPIAPPLTLEWERDVAAGMGIEPPVKIDSVLLVGTMRGELVALHIENGSRIGAVNLGNSIHATPAAAGGIAYVSLSGSRESLLAYDLLEGRSLWKQTCGDLQASPVLIKDQLFIGNTTGTFYSVAAGSGDILWKFELPNNIRLKGIRATAAGDSTGIIFGGDDAAVYALDPRTGIQIWRFEVDGAVLSPISISGNIVFASTSRGTLYAIDRTRGTSRWSARTESPIYARAETAEGMVIVGSTNGALQAFDLESGRSIWRYVAGGPINAGVLVSGPYVYLGTLKKEILALEVKTGTVVWRTVVAGRIKTRPLAAGGKVIIATDEPSVMAFRGATP